MSGLFQFGMERFRAGSGWIGKRCGLRESLAFAALLCLALVVAQGRAWGQQQEPDEGGMNDTALQKKAKAEKKPGEVLPPPSGMSFVTRLDHTAVWVGDQFHYLIIVEYTPEFEFVLDNLTKETVNMDPLQVMDVGKTTFNLQNNSKRLFVDLTLANFGTGQTSMQIPQFTLYYFRKDRKTANADQAAAESLTVPGPTIGIRSTLPPQAQDIRDFISVNSWERSRWILPAVGAVCGVVLLIGLGSEAVTLIRRRKARRGPDPRKAMEAVRSRWASSVPSDFSDPKTALDFFNNSYQNVKEFVGYYLETPTMGLTAEELQEEMQRLSANPDFIRKVVKVLDTCELLRYAPIGVNGASTDAARGVAQDVREILNTKA